MGRYFWLQIDLHSFTLTFLPWILKSIVQNDLVHHWTTERFVLWQTHVVLSDLWVICPPFHLNKPGFAWMISDSRGMWMHFTQRPLRLTTFHFSFFFTQSRLLSPSLLSEYAVKWRACQGAWSVHRCPAVYWGREGKGRGECGGVGVERLDHMNPGKWPSNIQFAAVTFRNPGIHKHYFIQVFFFFFLRYLSYFTIPFKSLLTHVHNSRIN